MFQMYSYGFRTVKKAYYVHIPLFTYYAKPNERLKYSYVVSAFL